MTNTYHHSFLRALFPQQFPEAEKPIVHRNKRVKYVHEHSAEQELFDRDEYEADRACADDEHQLRLEYTSSAKALMRRKMAERVTIDPDGDLLLILNERRKESRDKRAWVRAVVPVDDSAIAIETGTDGEEGYIGDAEKEREKEREEEGREKELKEIHMLVSSKHMVLVSPVFKAMLQWSNFKEGYAMKSHGEVEIPLPDDDPDAMRILVDIVHCHHKDVPRKVKLGLLTHLAVLVDKYRLHEAVQIYSDMWISHAKKKFPSSMAEDGVEICLQWLCISWVFEKPRDFTSMTRIFQQESTQSLSSMISESPWDIPVPSNVVENIEQDRIRALDEAISALRDTIESYQTSTLVCRASPAHLSADEVPQHNKQCDAMVLGMLIKEAIHHNLYPFPEAPYTGHSFVSIYDSYQSFDIKNACELVLLCSRDPANEPNEMKHIFGGVLVDLMVPIERDLCGLELNGFKASLGLV
ncbi:hypothetical protein DSL72_005197 [Monilinia vaccinii-corymbosi]|uniref:BTB domain-containing protein n=1 Tax=Monilinia vaccinii-corymbosi TaxID=61207 RepID=A0A8A3PEY5_9HELO|nr:hypothetical protein DSL72_005197 [Monilinia vaccinii-corymbosi]